MSSVQLVITSYYLNGKIETLTRAYLDSRENPAYEQARAHWQEAGYHSDYNTEVQHNPVSVSRESLAAEDLRDELPAHIGRICALTAIEEGAPAIPEGIRFEDWQRDVAPWQGDFDFLRGTLANLGIECSAEVERVFVAAYLTALFDESECGPAPLDLSEVETKGYADGAEEARDFYREAGIEDLRKTLSPSQLGWDEGARNAGAFENVFGRGHTERERETYYDAYNRGAYAETHKILREEEEE